LATLLLSCIPLAVAYGASRADSIRYDQIPNKSAGLIAQQEAVSQGRALLSLGILAVSTVVCGIGVYLSERR
jgi:hypothetical protein